MRKRKNNVKVKSSEIILLILFTGIFLVGYVLYWIAFFIDYFISVSKDWNYLQWGYGVALFIAFLYSLYNYRSLKQKMRLHNQMLIERQREEKKLQELKKLADLDKLKAMHPREFEFYIADLFSTKGYEAIVTSASGDGGKDIVLTREGKTSVVECKRYAHKKIGRPDIQKFHSALIDSQAIEGFFVTTSCFAKTSIQYVQDKPIQLIDGEALINLIHDIKNSPTFE
ncbi:restriction endonuclease [Priestia flexa]|uniref:restriction endonuclease n=1 Tax=Priestia flexa TaxID=86664 RepID=UPI002890DFED|nr:restriction endonuclease [Priestia flexa]MDT2048020.1 restriction endonuclease [Priestia flexa]